MKEKLRGVRYEFIVIVLALMAAAFTAGYFTGVRNRGDNIVINNAASVQPEAESPLRSLPSPSEDRAADDGLVNINTAGKYELMSLPGVGESIAQRIIDYRQEHGDFSSTEELMLVNGIGEKKYDGLKDHVTVSEDSQ